MRYEYVENAWGWFLLAGLSLGLAACGVATGGGECEFSEDCAGGEVCYQGGPETSSQCVTQCQAGQDQCEGNEQCLTEEINAPTDNPDIGGCVPQSTDRPGDDNDNGNDNGGSGCQTNDDCPGAQVCNQRVNECRSLGGGNGQDAGLDGGMSGDDGGTRLRRDGGPGGCTNNSDCSGSKVCNEKTGECESLGGGGDTVKFLQLVDVTESNRSGSVDCSSNSAGADVFGARLNASSGAPLGWATTVDAKLETSGEYTQVDTIFSGSEPSLQRFDRSGKMCPTEQGGSKFRSDTVVSLGCGGSVVVGFKGGEGGYQALENGQQLTVFEYGNQCFANPNCDTCQSEYVEVRACTGSSSELAGGDFSSCSSTLGSGADQFNVTLSF
jgi:hypothetical protein